MMQTRKSAILRKQFALLEYVLIGIQEARTKASTLVAKDFIAFASGADDAGNGFLKVADFDIILRKRTKISTATDRADEAVHF